jgi:SAM-dependent methyltransferase
MVERNIPKYSSVTELGGDDVSTEQVQRIHHRYSWACTVSSGKDVVELACGSGQGLGMLLKVAKTVSGSDIDQEILDRSKCIFDNKVKLECCPAEATPYANSSFDVVILFEAIYYIKNLDSLFAEFDRILKPGGVVLIATANKDLPGFNPSPFSYRYFNGPELVRLFQKYGFDAKTFGYMAADSPGLVRFCVNILKQVAVKLDLIPKTMAGKKLLKRVFFGQLVEMPVELSGGEFNYEAPSPISSSELDFKHKVIYCLATKR